MMHSSILFALFYLISTYLFKNESMSPTSFFVLAFVIKGSLDFALEILF